jgi:site-specific recombinase XerD
MTILYSSSSQDNTFSEQNTSLITSTPHAFTVDEMVQIWLHAKANKSGSFRTKEQYEDHMKRFRAILQQSGIDLGSPDEATIAALAQGYAAWSFDGRTVAGATYNQRLASISSFYVYSIKRRWLLRNPIELVERRVAHYNNAALPLDTEMVKQALKSIDRSTLLGKRDYALLVILLNTGRRVTEVCELKCGDIDISGTVAVITWRRTKGGKTMRDQLTPKVAKALIDYLQDVYKGEWRDDAPVWISFSRYNGKKRVAIGTQAIAAVCQKYFGISKVHATRHSFAVMMESAGAKLSDIGARLGHANLATTSTYMQRLHSAENKFAGDLERMLDID